MVKVNSGGGGRPAPRWPPARASADKAKKEDSITPEKKSDYDKTFDDPMPEDARRHRPGQGRLLIRCFLPDAR